MLKKLLTSTLILAVCVISRSQDYISNTYLETLESSYFFSTFGLSVINGVDLYRMEYTTIGSDGLLDTASGLVVLPTNKDITYNTVVYHHGTVGSRFEVPGYGSFERVLPAILGAYGFVAIAPDYLGLGSSRGFHPYIHAATQASSSRDMVLAVKQFLELQDYQTDNTLMMTGYSQGGHAGMATHRLFEEQDLGYEVVAASHMSGPYDISGAMKSLLLSDDEYPLVAYVPNVVLGYNEVYGLFEKDLSDIFLPQYANKILEYYREETDLWSLNEELVDLLRNEFGKANPNYMLVPDTLAAINSNPDHPVNQKLRENDVYDWAPNAATLLIYCGMDEQVAPVNSITADSVMRANGASNVRLVLADANGDLVGPMHSRFGPTADGKLQHST